MSPFEYTVLMSKLHEGLQISVSPLKKTMVLMCLHAGWRTYKTTLLMHHWHESHCINILHFPLKLSHTTFLVKQQYKTWPFLSFFFFFLSILLLNRFMMQVHPPTENHSKKITDKNGKMSNYYIWKKVKILTSKFLHAEHRVMLVDIQLQNGGMFNEGPIQKQQLKREEKKRWS